MGPPGTASGMDFLHNLPCRRASGRRSGVFPDSFRGSRDIKPRVLSDDGALLGQTMVCTACPPQGQAYGVRRAVAGVAAGT
jgi:hypothetical protein